MIYCLTGKIVKKTLDSVVLSCAGVGYLARVPQTTAGRLPAAGETADQTTSGVPPLGGPRKNFSKFSPVPSLQTGADMLYCDSNKNYYC